MEDIETIMKLVEQVSVLSRSQCPDMRQPWEQAEDEIKINRTKSLIYLRLLKLNSANMQLTAEQE